MSLTNFYVSPEKKLQSAETLYESAKSILDRVEKKVEEFKNEGRIEDAIFAAKVATAWSNNYEYLSACAAELKEFIEAGLNVDDGTPSGLSFMTNKLIQKGLAKLVVENYQLYNQIVGSNIVEDDLDRYYKRFAKGKIY